MFLVMSDDFLNNKIQKFLGKLRVEIGPHSQILKPCNLRGLTREEVELRRALCRLVDDVKSEHIVQGEPRHERVEVLERREEGLRLAEVVQL